MYNGEYGKGFIHVLIFGTLIWAADHVSGIFGIGIAAFALYMPIEAYQTAKASVMGVAASGSVRIQQREFVRKREPSLPQPRRCTSGSTGGRTAVPQQRLQRIGSRVPVGALVLIGLGVLFLLNQFDWFHFDWIGKLWPLHPHRHRCCRADEANGKGMVRRTS